MFVITSKLQRLYESFKQPYLVVCAFHMLASLLSLACLSCGYVTLSFLLSVPHLPVSLAAGPHQPGHDIYT